MARDRLLRAVLLASVLFAAACAGNDTVSAEAANSADDTTAEATPAADSDTAESESTDDATTDDEPAPDDESATNGEETSAPVNGPPPSLPPEEARAAAEQNIPNLEPSDDVRDIDVVSVYDGSITSLREVVTGDRPVLLWFWAPH